LFSHHWVSRWQRQWKKNPARNASGNPPAVGENSCRRSAKKPKRAPERFYQRIFSLRVTLWYLIFQRLNFDHSLAAVVADLRGGGADRLGGRGRKLSKKVRSTKTSAYNQARQRLPLEMLQAALAHLGQHLLPLVGLAPAPKEPPGPAGRARQLLDGSTLALLSTPELAAAYRPARNQNGTSDWLLMRIVVGFCARSGAVLSAIEGAIQQSEQVLAWTLIEAAARFTVWIGDRNFGVWSVVAKAVHHQQDVLVRLTKARAAKLAGGRPLQSGEDRPVDWSPTRHDQVPRGVKRAPVSGRLIYVRLRKNRQWIDLWLFTTLPAKDYSVELLVSWYGQRWQAELHFRSVKTHMKMDELDVCSPQMARKEFYTALLAYNLVRTAMWAAGERLESGIKALSFSQARRVVLQRLNAWAHTLIAVDQWTRLLLEEVAQQTLPKRRKERPSEVRRARYRREKFPPLKGSRAAARAREQITKSL
jgi:hypothetical protein